MASRKLCVVYEKKDEVEGFGRRLYTVLQDGGGLMHLTSVK